MNPHFRALNMSECSVCILSCRSYCRSSNTDPKCFKRSRQMQGVINSWWIGGPMGTQEIGWNWFVWNFATSSQFRQDHLQSSFAQVLSEIRSKQSGACVAFTDLTFAAFCMDSWWGLDEVTTWQWLWCLLCVQNLFVRVAESLLWFHPRFWSLLICYIVQAAFLVVGFIFIGSMPSVLGNNMHVYCQVTNDYFDPSLLECVSVVIKIGYPTITTSGFPVLQVTWHPSWRACGKRRNWPRQGRFKGIAA